MSAGHFAAIESAPTSNIVAFPGARRTPRHDQRGLLEAVYAAGVLPVAADDHETKLMAARLQIFGFFVIEEVGTDGTTRKLKASEAISAGTGHPCRVSKPSFGGGLPQADARRSFRPPPREA